LSGINDTAGNARQGAVSYDERVTLEIGPDLVGKRVSNAARLDWGVGTVLRVQPIRVAEAPAHRVSIQFSSGHRTLIVPPAKLIPRRGEVPRAEGGMDKLAGKTADDRLRRLPSDIAEFLGTPAQRLTIAASMYHWTDEPAQLEKWARQQAQIADPLTLWT